MVSIRTDTSTDCFLHETNEPEMIAVRRSAENTGIITFFINIYNDEIIISFFINGINCENINKGGFVYSSTFWDTKIIGSPHFWKLKNDKLVIIPNGNYKLKNYDPILKICIKTTHFHL